MDYATFESFIHPDLKQAFVDADPSLAVLKNSYNLACSNYNTLATKMSNSSVILNFDSDTYILKFAFIKVYDWILQNSAFLKNVSLTGLQIDESDMFDHFFKLRTAEMNDVESMRKEAIGEYESKTGSGSGGMMVRHRPVKNSYGLNRKYGR